MVGFPWLMTSINTFSMSLWFQLLVSKSYGTYSEVQILSERVIKQVTLKGLLCDWQVAVMCVLCVWEIKSYCTIRTKIPIWQWPKYSDCKMRLQPVQTSQRHKFVFYVHSTLDDLIIHFIWYFLVVKFEKSSVNCMCHSIIHIFVSPCRRVERQKYV